MGSTTANTGPDEYDLKIDGQVEKFLDLKQKLTYFLITASVGPIAFALDFVKDETKNLSSIWIAMGLGVVIGLLAGGFALFSLHFELTSYQKHLGSRYARMTWANLTKPEQDKWNKINAWAHRFLKCSFIALFMEIAILAIVLMLLLYAKTHASGADKTEVASPESNQRTVQIFDASGSFPPFVPGSSSDLSGNLVEAVCRAREALQEHDPPAAIVTGRSDRRELSHVAFLHFGSNAGLAQQRAENIGEKLKNENLCKAAPVKHVTILIGGPRHTDLRSYKTELERQQALSDDRRVQVEGIGFVQNPHAPVTGGHK